MKANRTVVVAPTLGETCEQLEELYLGVMAGGVPLDKARLGLSIKKTQMSRFSLQLAAARLHPAARPALTKLLGLPSAETQAVSSIRGAFKAKQAA